jgi:hypothetical protein
MLGGLVALDVARRRVEAQFETDVRARAEARGGERPDRSRSRAFSALGLRLLGRPRQRPAAAPSTRRSVPGARHLEPERR